MNQFARLRVHTRAEIGFRTSSHTPTDLLPLSLATYVKSHRIAVRYHNVLLSLFRYNEVSLCR